MTTLPTNAASDSQASTGQPQPVCGDGIVEGSEFCDDAGSTIACDLDCTAVLCGDLVANKDAGEECDDGNTLPGDTCSAACARTKIVDVALGGTHTCVRFDSGGIRCWGDNTWGQLQLGNKDPVALIMPAPELDLNDILPAKIVSGAFHSCQLSKMGNVYCWGSGGSLESGPDPLILPRPKMNLPNGQGAIDVAAGSVHSCAITSNHRVACWGYGAYGQIGANTALYGNEPTMAIGIEGADELTLGEAHTCVRQGGAVRCWGLNSTAQLGLGHTDDVGKDAMVMPMPPPAVDLDGPALRISAGLHFTCALLLGGAVVCWGENTFGQLGNGSPGIIGDEPGEMGAMLTPVNLGDAATQIAAGPHHACALLASRTVKCWGYAGAGALGYGNTEDIDQPVELAVLEPVNLGGTASEIRANSGYELTKMEFGGHTCALLDDGSMRCWGANGSGQLGFDPMINLGGTLPSEVGPVPF